MDDELGWPSEDFEFTKVADALKYKSVIIVMKFRSKQAANADHEFYARLFAYYYAHRDQVPDEFAPFYDWSIVDRLSVEPGGIPPGGIQPGFYWLGYRAMKADLQQYLQTR